MMLNALIKKIKHKIIFYAANAKDAFISRKRARLLKKHAIKTRDFFFIQLGAYASGNDDPIKECILKYKWSGILVEPVRYLFDRLIDSYKQADGLSFENIAISHEAGPRDFYRLKENQDNLPPWSEELGSFFKDIVLKHRKYIPDIDKYLICEKVNCITLRDLLGKHDVKKIDLLQIDTEGYDYEIIKMIDFAFLKPGIIWYEHKHLKENDIKECETLLKNSGYHMLKDQKDTFAYPA